MTGLSLSWRAREAPLPPVAVAATGEAGRALARRALESGPEALGKLQGVSAEGVLLLLGAEGDLPWADGVNYLGVDPLAPSLLLPCHSAPNVPAALLERAVTARCAGAPVAVLPGTASLVSAADARPVTAQRLEAWLSR